MLAAAGSYVIWGVLPFYWKALEHVPALEILGHRIVWSLATAMLLLALMRRRPPIRQVLARRRLLLSVAASATLIAINWLVYVWATNNGHIVEASLGYFVAPLSSVVLGLVVLRERLRLGQWFAVAVAASGVAYMVAASAGTLWVSIALAGSFSVYGLLRKTTSLPSLEGLAAELTILTPISAAGLLAWAWQGEGSFGSVDAATTLLLAGAGAVTAAPLLLFAYGAKRIPLSTLGLLQYLAPALQLAIGVRFYGEAFTSERALGFVLVWTALAVFTFEGIAYARHARASSRVPAAS